MIGPDEQFATANPTAPDLAGIPALVADAWAAAWTPPDRRQIHEWARDHVELHGGYAKTGPFRLDDTRYLIKPFEYAFDDRVRMLNILKAVQTFGSGLCDVYLQWAFKNAPGPFMWNGPTDDDSEAHYLTRLKPTFEASRVNRELFSQLRKKRTLLMWPHMHAYIQGANLNSLQMKSIRYQVNDEVWEWVKGMLGEAWARSAAYSRTCKIFNVSQGGYVGTDWENAYNEGHRHDWGTHCANPTCSHHQPLDFFGHRLGTPPDSRRPEDRAAIVWDHDARHPSGRWDYDRVAATTRYRCVKCGHEHPDHPRTWEHFNRAGEYLDRDPARSIKNSSFRWTGLVRGQYGDMAVRYLKAIDLQRQGSTTELEKFYLKELALFWDPSMAVQRVVLRTGEFLKENPRTLAGKRNPDYKPTPIPGEKYRFLTADYQQGHGDEGRHFWVVARAWRAKGHGSRLLYEGRVKTFEDIHELATTLGIRPPCVNIDGGYEMMEVAAACARYGWTMLRGDDAETFLHKPTRQHPKGRRRPFSPKKWADPHKGKASAGRTGCWYFEWSNPSIKNILWNLRHAVGTRWELPADLSPEYKDQIDSEHKKKFVSKTTGAVEWRWIQYKDANHLWDCECMQVVCALIAGLIDFDLVEEAVPPSTSNPAEPTPTDAAAPDAGHRPAQTKGSLTPPHDQPQQLTLLPT